MFTSFIARQTRVSDCEGPRFALDPFWFLVRLLRRVRVVCEICHVLLVPLSESREVFTLGPNPTRTHNEEACRGRAVSRVTRWW